MTTAYMDVYHCVIILAGRCPRHSPVDCDEPPHTKGEPLVNPPEGLCGAGDSATCIYDDLTNGLSRAKGCNNLKFSHITWLGLHLSQYNSNLQNYGEKIVTSCGSYGFLATKKGACSRKLPSKMESKMPYTIICLNLHVQVGSLSLVFVLRSRRSNSRKLKSGTLL